MGASPFIERKAGTQTTFLNIAFSTDEPYQHEFIMTVRTYRVYSFCFEQAERVTVKIAVSRAHPHPLCVPWLPLGFRPPSLDSSLHSQVASNQRWQSSQESKEIIPDIRLIRIYGYINDGQPARQHCTCYWQVHVHEAQLYIMVLHLLDMHGIITGESINISTVGLGYH